MSWSESYRSKLMSAAQALEAVASGDRVWIQSGCGTPSVLVDALVARAPHVRDVEVVHMMTLGAADYTKPEFEGHFRHRGLFLGANVREAVAAGRADYTPIFLSEIEDLFESGAMPLDVVLMQVSPPDAHGFVSLGTTVDCTLTAARCAKTVIAEVNERMPRTHGDTFVHVSRISAVVETSRPLLELHAEPCTETHLRVARNVASLIPDGATIQTGIGGISEAVLQCLCDKRDLGIQTEMCPDGIVDLIESGVINGERKTLHRGKAVVSFVLGTQRLFDCIHENPSFEFRPIRYTNDPFVVAQNDRMVAINSALQIDLTGQVCADSLGTRPSLRFSETANDEPNAQPDQQHRPGELKHASGEDIELPQQKQQPQANQDNGADRLPAAPSRGRNRGHGRDHRHARIWLERWGWRIRTLVRNLLIGGLETSVGWGLTRLAARLGYSRSRAGLPRIRRPWIRRPWIWRSRIR